MENEAEVLSEFYKRAVKFLPSLSLNSTRF